METKIVTVPNASRVDGVSLESRWSSRDCTLGGRPFLAVVHVEYRPKEEMLEFCSFEKWLLRFVEMSVTLESSCREIFDALSAVLGEGVDLRVTITGDTTTHGPASAYISRGEWK